MYSSRIPAVTGPVRSAQQDDLEPLRQSGRPGFACSGATPHLLPFTAPARAVNLFGTPACFRGDDRAAQRNLDACGRVLPARARGLARPVLTTTDRATAGL